MEINKLASFSLISLQWHKYKKTYLDNFIPLFCTMLIDNTISKIEIKDYPELVDLFRKMYSIDLPLYVVQAIIDAMYQFDFLNKEQTTYIINTNKIIDNKFYISEIQNECLAKQSIVVKSFCEYVKEHLNKNLDNITATKLLLEFIKRNDVSLFLDNNINLDDTISDSQNSITAEEYYLTGSFINWIYRSNPSIYKNIVDFSVGNIAFNALKMNSLPKEAETLKKCVIFLDASHIFPLLGIDQNDRFETVKLIIKTIHEKGGFVKIYQHTYDEIKEIIDTATKYIESPLYDPYKATKALLYMRQEGFSQTRVEAISASLDRKLKQYKIDIEKELPDRKLGLDENKLTEFIKNRNIHKRFHSEEFYIKRTERDVSSIIFTYEKRKKLDSVSFIDAKYIFITENPVLSLADKNMIKEFDIFKESLVLAAIPETLLCSYLWFGSPEKAEEYLTFELLGMAFSAISPTPEIIQKLKIEIKKLYDIGDITENDYLIMSTEYIIKNALSEKTLNNPANLTNDTIFDLAEIAKDKLAIKDREERKEIEKRFYILSNDTEKRSNNLKEKAKHNADKNTNRTIWIFRILFILLHIVIPGTISILQSIFAYSNILILLFSIAISLIIYILNIEKEFSLSGKRTDLYNKYLLKWYKEYELDTAEFEK